MSKNFSYSFRRLVGAIINVLKVNDCQAIFRYFDFFFAAFRLQPILTISLFTHLLYLRFWLCINFLKERRHKGIFVNNALGLLNHSVLSYVLLLPCFLITSSINLRNSFCLHNWMSNSWVDVHIWLWQRSQQSRSYIIYLWVFQPSSYDTFIKIQVRNLLFKTCCHQRF